MRPFSIAEDAPPMGGAWALPGLAALRAETAGDPRVTVAVLDGPVDLTHPCFAGAELTSLTTFIPDEGSGSDHGTHVASVLFGQPGGPLRGLAPRCRGLIVPVYSQRADGSLVPCRQMDLARAINQAVGYGAQVINISGGELTHAGEADHYLAESVRRASESGALIISAVGNDGCECLHVPAALPSVLAIGAHDDRGQPMSFSNWGESIARQGILAPGKDIAGALPGGGTGLWSGTSFATPVVSGIVALLLSLQLARGRRLDPQAVRAALLASAVPCAGGEERDCERLLSGRLDIAGARARLELAARVPEIITSHGRPTRDAAASGSRSNADARSPISKLRKETDMEQESTLHTPPPEGAGPSATSGVAPACACQGAVSPQNEGDDEAGIATAAAGGSAPAGALVVRGGGDLVSAASYRPAAEPATGVRTSCHSPASGVAASARPHRETCGPRGGSNYAYVLGELGYDFGCEARLDYFVQQLGEMGHAFDPVKMAEHLDEKKGGHPEDANALIWTLNIDATPVYALEPDDQFAVISYVLLTRFLVDQELEGVERISIAGHITGSQRLYNGTVVPIIAPVTRGMFNWNVDKLVKSVLGEGSKDDQKYKAQADGIRQFLQRIYYELRNLGTAPQERAMNFAATNAFQIREVFDDAYKESLHLDTIEVERSPICRPDSDCWDVKLKFFDPAKRFERARKIYRYTVDVSDIVPVTVGTLRTWFVY